MVPHQGERKSRTVPQLSVCPGQFASKLDANGWNVDRDETLVGGFELLDGTIGDNRSTLGLTSFDPGRWSDRESAGRRMLWFAFGHGGDHRTTGLADAGDFVSEAASLLTQRCETVGMFLRQRLR